MLIAYDNFDLTRYEADTHLRSGVLHKNHTARKIQAGIRSREIGNIHVRIREPE